MQKLGGVSLIVADYDEAIEYYTKVLGFELVQDEPQAEKRWVVVKPKGPDGSHIILAQAKNDSKRDAIGRQGAGRVWLFLHTDDFERDHQIYLNKGVRFLETPRNEDYGKVAVFEDIYRNKWDLLELK